MRTLLIFLLLTTGMLLILSACSSGPLESAVEGELIEDGTPQPTPTMDPSGYREVPSQACLAGDWPTIQAERRQRGLVSWQRGNLIAWQPRQGGSREVVDRLAYLAPIDQSSWFNGQLMIALGPNFTEHTPIAVHVQVSGDLTWSPSGERLAFLALRPEDGLFTVMSVRADGSELIDLLPAELARTDTYTSEKAILGWKNDTTIQMITSCGDGCRLAYDLNVTHSAEFFPEPTPIDDYHQLKENLEIEQYVLEYTPEAFPKSVTQPKWSPNELLIDYLDKNGILWILDTREKVHFKVDIGLRSVYETKWSPGSDHLAVRAEDRIFVFRANCE